MPLLRLIDAHPNPVHKGVGQVWNGHTASGMHVKTTHTHLLHVSDFPFQEIFIQITVPGPKRRTPVFRPGIFEQFLIRFLFAVMRVKHRPLPFISPLIAGILTHEVKTAWSQFQKASVSKPAVDHLFPVHTAFLPPSSTPTHLHREIPDGRLLFWFLPGSHTSGKSDRLIHLPPA